MFAKLCQTRQRGAAAKRTAAGLPSGMIAPGRAAFLDEAACNAIARPAMTLPLPHDRASVVHHPEAATMFASMIRNIRLHAAARRYAAKLPAQILTDYGTRDTYTPAQIAKSAARAGLPANMIALGYAAFLPEATFNAIPNRPAWVAYQTLRALIARYTAPRDCADDATAPEDHFGATGGFS